MFGEVIDGQFVLLMHLGIVDVVNMADTDAGVLQIECVTSHLIVVQPRVADQFIDKREFCPTCFAFWIDACCVYISIQSLYNIILQTEAL